MANDKKVIRGYIRKSDKVKDTVHVDKNGEIGIWNIWDHEGKKEDWEEGDYPPQKVKVTIELDEGAKKGIPFCDSCEEKDCLIGIDEGCALLRVYREAKLDEEPEQEQEKHFVIAEVRVPSPDIVDKYEEVEVDGLSEDRLEIKKELIFPASRIKYKVPMKGDLFFTHDGELCAAKNDQNMERRMCIILEKKETLEEWLGRMPKLIPGMAYTQEEAFKHIVKMGKWQSEKPEEEGSDIN